MALPGKKPRPTLAIVREGNATGHSQERLDQGLKLRPKAPAEPSWFVWFPGKDPEVKRLRDHASKEWRRVVPVLEAQGLLAEVDRTVLSDYCVTVSRLMQCERDITERGTNIRGERGWQRNGSLVAVNQYRASLKFYLAELGLTPSSRGRLPGATEGSGDDDDSPFD